jgi:arylsulfatase A-like enzyme
MRLRKLQFLFALLMVATPTWAWAKPNILHIIADDMGLDASRCYRVGGQQATMPNLEKLCAEGLVFENAYSAPTCSPTRASIMTGRYGFRTGVGGAIPMKGNVAGLSSDETSLFDVLNKTEYSTGVIGKWHLAGNGAGLDHPSTLGVPEYFGLYSGGVRDYFSWDAVENGKPLKVNEYTTTALTNRAVDWIAKQKTPWFLWLAYNAPHTPFHLPPAKLQSAGSLTSDEASIAANPLPYYNAMLEALDTEIGRLLATLPKDVRDNTVVIFIGDNGTPSQISAPLYGKRRSKGSIFEGGSHIPMIVAGVGIKVGRTDALANTSDVHATIATLAGAVPAAAAIDSIDMTPLFAGGKGARNVAYVEHFGPNKMPPDVFGWAIRDQRYKLVAEDGEPQLLFDLESDPMEKSNLLTDAASPDIVAKAKYLQESYDQLRSRK